MIGAFAGNMLDAYRAPRPSVRRVIDAAPGVGDCVMMIVLAYAIQALLAGAMALIDPGLRRLFRPGDRAPGLEIAVQVGFSFMIAGIAFSIGSRFGGSGRPRDLLAAISWHAVATSILAPTLLIVSRPAVAERAPSMFEALAFLTGVGLSLWLLAAFIAEAHGFRRTGPVIGGILLASLAFFVLFAILSAAFLGG